MGQTNRTSRTKQLTITAALTAIGILIPMVMPIRLVIGPASYTLGSHIPLFLAMFISPTTAILVTLGTTLGFFIGGFPIIIVLRALSHLVFVSIGAYYLNRDNVDLQPAPKRYLFSFVLNLIHGIGEVVVVFVFTAVGSQGLDANFWYTLFVLVGIGTVIHGMIDFELAYYFARVLQGRTRIQLPNLN
ncbi:hypothetical protein [Fundicoccus culcitae]|uniref:Niacin transporter NiaX n=1 Tax=Fundicoccus culcitae TaxID=2969821 RepID=A0ABY5P2Z3_9LACT|nr:hypothetical protein [Fundicoccus culcitae]UUX33098.1 hypothetical protein NRE15_09275 [Fundicoccus culcitae]